MRKIITAKGEIISLTDWQKTKGYSPTQLGKYFSTNENKLSNENWYLHEYLFLILDKLREYAKKPIRINSAYRTEQEQKELKETNLGAATYSPHCHGGAIDLDTISNAETLRYVILLRKIAKELDLQIRIGWQQYQKLGSTFIHIDVMPEMYGKGKCWEFMPNIPQVYKTSIEW